MKRKLWTVLSAVLACLCLCFGLVACGETESGSNGNNSGNGSSNGSQVKALEYELDQNTDTYTVTGIGTLNGDIVVPVAYKRKPVTSIGKGAFRNCFLKNVQFKGTVEEWQAVEKDFDLNWEHYSGDRTVTCTDGTVAKDGTVTYF